MTKASDNAFPSLLITEGTEPSAPAAGKQRLYIDSTSHKLKATNSSGTERDIEGTALGAWTTYTPTWISSGTQPVLGSSTLAGKYKLLDANTLAFSIALTITTGGAFSAGTGAYSFALPAGVTSAARRQVVAGYFLDNGTKHYAGIGVVDASTSTVSGLILPDTSSIFVWQHNIPVTLATGDACAISGMIEIA